MSSKEFRAMISLLIPDMPKTDEILPYLRRIDVNRQYTNFGPLNKELEHRLKTFLSPSTAAPISDNLHITTLANATLGLEAIFSCLRLPKNAKVLVPALTFPATATAVLRQGMTPVFSDIHPKSWLMTPEIAKQALEKNSLIDLVVPVAAFGVPQPTQEWDRFIDETGVPVVIDAAGAFGNQYASQKTHLVFSLHATKSLGGGEGGFIATTDQALIERIRTASNFGIDAKQYGQITCPGTNAKLSEYHAAVTLAALDRLHLRQPLRMKLLNEWLTQLSPFLEHGKITIQQHMEKYSHSLLPLRFQSHINIPHLATCLAEKNIQTRRWYYPLLPRHPGFSGSEVVGNISAAEKLAEELLGLPFHLDLETTDINYMVETMSKFLV
jgi:dTDP-4-amino-4,6-dideoxygalactose transaminase